MATLKLCNALFLIKFFIYSFICLHQWLPTHSFLLYSVCYKLLPPLFILVPQLSQIWPVGAPLCWLRSSLGMPPSFFSTSLLPGTASYFRFILYFPCSSPEVSPSCKSTQVSFQGESYLETMIWGHFSQTFSVDSVKEPMYTGTRAFVHIISVSI